MNQPRHFELVFLLAVFFSFSFISQSVADNSPRPPVFSEHEKALHQERMKYMTAEEKARYRDEQYQILKQRAAAIGYSMPDTPPWKEAAAAEAPVSKEESLHELHQKQLETYRQAAADKRKAMQDKIEKQREEIQQRIDRLVQQNAIKATPPAPPQPPQPPAFSGYQSAPPVYPAYPGYYMMPPMPAYRY